MAHPLRGETDFELDGKPYKLKLDFGDIEALDEATQKGPADLLNSLHPRIARMALILVVLEHAVRDGGGKKLPKAHVKSLVQRAGFIEAVRAAQTILTLCLTDPSIKGNADEPDAEATVQTGE